MERREAIADAVIELLATDGARGLTHRAVDRQLDLPAGSTSYYFRTRSLLIAAAVERLAALDQADVDAVSGEVDGVAKLVDRWLRPANRARLTARFELFLASSRSLDDAPLADARTAFRRQLTDALDAIGATDPALGAVALIATIEGLLLDGLLGGKLTLAERHLLIARAIGAAVGPRT